MSNNIIVLCGKYSIKMLQLRRLSIENYNRTHICAFITDEKKGITNITISERLLSEQPIDWWLTSLAEMMRLKHEDYRIPDKTGECHSFCRIKPKMYMQLILFGIAKSRICDKCLKLDFEFGDCAFIRFIHCDKNYRQSYTEGTSLCRECAKIENNEQDTFADLIAVVDPKKGEIVLCNTYCKSDDSIPVVKYVPERQ